MKVRRTTSRVVAVVVSVGVLGGACASDGGGALTETTAPTTRPDARHTFPPAPAVPAGDVAAAAATRAFDRIVDGFAMSGSTTSGLDDLVAAGDARHAWLVSDLLRFTADRDDFDRLVAAFVELTGIDPTRDPSFADSPWRSVTDHLIAWDLPAPPAYRASKGRLFTLIDERWAPFFADTDAAIDWRLLSWGGVRLDDRPLGDPAPCARGCIPALDDPVLTAASEGVWYPDEALVFGVREGNEVVALPKHMMEVHELVNMTIGGRRFAIPYCTLCGSAQAYYTDTMPAGVEVPVLRTSGLLSRSNKVMFDLVTMSVFDTFTGEAVSGPLQDAGVALTQTTVTVTTWGEWRDAHPETTIIARDGGIGRQYPLDPLRGRDDDGPIFPIGDTDERLPVQTEVLGVITADGTPVAFPADAARRALGAGDDVGFGGVELTLDGGGLRAHDGAGVELAAHEAFWFAWSQFHPRTELWQPG